MRRKPLMAVLTCALTVVPLVGLTALPAAAAPQTHTSSISLHGTSPEQFLIGKGIFCDDCLPDALFDCGSGCQVAAGATAVVHTSVDWTAPVSIDTKSDPDELHQGQTAGVKDTLTPGAGPIKINYHISYAIGVFACDGDFDPCGADPKNWQPTGNLTYQDDPTLTAGTNCTPPVGGDPNATCVASNSINLFPETCFLPGCPVDITVDLVINHTFTVTPGNMVVGRTATFVPNTNLTFSGGTPSVKNDSIPVPCSAAPGTTVNYQLGPASYSPGSVNVAGEAHLHVNIDGPGPLNAEPDIALVSGTAFSDGITMTGAPDSDFALGDVLLDNVPPNISAIVRAGTFVEGADDTFTAVATDNCASTLGYEWRFSDGGIAFSRIAHHVFADNGTYTAQLQVSDLAGNSVTTDIGDVTPIVITNADPSVTPPPPSKAGAWGDTIQYHADAIDPGPADQPTLHFTWAFGDGESAAGQDVSHVFATPNTYAGSVTVYDKDGGSGTANFNTAIARRATTLVYTGPITGKFNKPVTLAATLADDHSQPVNGGLVVYTLGAQTASDATNSAGFSSRILVLTQKKGVYPLGANFAQTSLYKGSSDAGTFQISG